jgi:hypothetical protein
MDFNRLNKDNYLLYAARHYDNPSCKSMEEFTDDLSRIVYVKRLLRKYERTGELRDRLLLNHIITLYNVFGSDAATRLMFFKLEPDLHSMLKTFMVYLGYVGDNTSIPEGIDIVRIPLDQKIIERLRSL